MIKPTDLNNFKTASTSFPYGEVVDEATGQTGSEVVRKWVNPVLYFIYQGFKLVGIVPDGTDEDLSLNSQGSKFWAMLTGRKIAIVNTAKKYYNGMKPLGIPFLIPSGMPDPNSSPYDQTYYYNISHLYTASVPKVEGTIIENSANVSAGLFPLATNILHKGGTFSHINSPTVANNGINLDAIRNITGSLGISGDQSVAALSNGGLTGAFKNSVLAPTAKLLASSSFNANSTATQQGIFDASFVVRTSDKDNGENIPYSIASRWYLPVGTKNDSDVKTFFKGKPNLTRDEIKGFFNTYWGWDWSIPFNDSNDWEV